MWVTSIYYECGFTVWDLYCNCRHVTQNENKCRKCKLHMKGKVMAVLFDLLPDVPFVNEYDISIVALTD